MGAHVARAAGETCHYCADRPEPGRRSCAVHLLARRELEAARREAMKARSKCVVCGKGVVTGLTVCRVHREYYRARAEAAANEE